MSAEESIEILVSLEPKLRQRIVLPGTDGKWYPAILNKMVEYEHALPPNILVLNMAVVELVSVRFPGRPGFFTTYEGVEYRVYWTSDWEKKHNAAS